MSLQSLPPNTIQGIQDAFALRYVSIAGFVILLYDHLLTIADEIQYIWKASNTIEKHVYLFNRYLIFSLLLVNVNEMCGFNNLSYTSRRCQILLILTFNFGWISAVVCNTLILIRVLYLWRDNKAMKIFLASMHAGSAFISVLLAIFTCIKSWPLVQWSYVVNMCIAIVPTSLVAFWAAPMFFEISMVISVIYRTWATPRSTSLPFIRALENNGIAFFLSVACLRLISVITISSSGRKTLVLLWVYFTWAFITTILCRSVLRLRKAEIKAQLTSDLFGMTNYHDTSLLSSSSTE